MTIPIQEGDTARLLRERFRLVGQIKPVLDSVITPTVDIGSLDVGAPPAVRRIAAAGVTVAAGGAGLFGGIRLEVPPRIVALVRTVRLKTSDAAAPTRVRVAYGSQLAGGLGIAGTPQYADGRVRDSNAYPGPATACVLSRNTQAAQIVATYQLAAAASPSLTEIAVDWPLGGLPSAFDFLEFQIDTANVDLYVGLEWIEYPPV